MHVQFGNVSSRSFDSVCKTRRIGSEIVENLSLEGEDLLFRSQNLAFKFLEFRGGEALGVCERLLTFVVGRAQAIGLLLRSRGSNRTRC